MLSGCRFPSTVEILSDDKFSTEYNEIVNLRNVQLHCLSWPRFENLPGIVNVFSNNRFDSKSEGWFAVLIKHGRFSEEHSSKFISVYASDNIEILESIGADLLPYERTSSNNAPYQNLPYKQRYNIELDYDYRSLIKFKFLETSGDSEIVIRYVYIPDEGGSDSRTLWTRFKNGNISNLRTIVDENCNPLYWDSIKYTEEEIALLNSANSYDEYHNILWEIIKKYNK